MCGVTVTMTLAMKVTDMSYSYFHSYGNTYNYRYVTAIVTVTINKNYFISNISTIYKNCISKAVKSNQSIIILVNFILD